MWRQEYLLEERGKRSKKDACGGGAAYTINNYDLDELLGKQWHMRVLNVDGDFSFAILGIISFQEYKVVKNDDGTYNFEKVFLEQNFLVFNIVRRDGTKVKLSNYI